MRSRLPLVTLLLLPAAGCMKAPDPSQAPAPKGAEMPGLPEGHPPLDELPEPAAPAEIEVTLTAPDDWTEVAPDQSFYLRKWELPGEGGGNATVTYMGNNPGMIQANVNRWLGQFDGDPASATQERLEGAHAPTTFLVHRGTFSATRSVGGGPARQNWMLVGAVAETDQGPIYFKAVGPESVLGGQVEALRTALTEAHFHP